MYKFNRNRLLSLSDFNQPIGLKMNPKNRWIKKAETIPWNEIEEQYMWITPIALKSKEDSVWRRGAMVLG